jgi:hypothetical protein
MKYRKYCKQIKIGSIITLALGLSACAYTPQKGDRQPDSVQTEENSGKAERIPSHMDGREPSSMKGDFTWLNEVEDDFGKIAAETSARTVASQNKHDVLMKEKEWSFSYLPKTNHFYVNLQGTQYQMVQTKIDDGERFAFAAEGQAENPLTFAVTKGEGRKVASGSSEACTAEISYWSKSAKSYVTDHKAVQGKSCARMLSLLKDYVP